MRPTTERTLAPWFAIYVAIALVGFGGGIQAADRRLAQIGKEEVEVERLSSHRASANALSRGGSIATKLSLIAGAALFLVSAVAQIDELWFRSDALPALARVVDKRLTAAWDYGAKVDAIGRPKPEFTTH